MKLITAMPHANNLDQNRKLKQIQMSYAHILLEAVVTSLKKPVESTILGTELYRFKIIKVF